MVGVTCPFRHRIPGVGLLTIAPGYGSARGHRRPDPACPVVGERHECPRRPYAGGRPRRRRPSAGCSNSRTASLDIPLAAVISSPLDRCLATAEPLLAGRPGLDARHRRGAGRVRLRRVDRAGAQGAREDAAVEGHPVAPVRCDVPRRRDDAGDAEPRGRRPSAPTTPRSRPRTARTRSGRRSATAT